MKYKVIKFGAEWCGPCKVLNSRFENFNTCEVEKIDVDDADEELLSKHTVRNIPLTVLVDENDNVIKKWIGIFDVNEITNLIKDK